MEGFNPLFLITPAFLIAGVWLIRINKRIKKTLKKWNYTTGVITEKRLWTKKGNARPTVRYKVAGEVYEYTSHAGQSPALRIGKKVGVYYNPDDVEKAVIDTFIQRGNIYTIVGFIFIAVGSVFLSVIYAELS